VSVCRKPRVKWREAGVKSGDGSVRVSGSLLEFQARGRGPGDEVAREGCVRRNKGENAT
jgi:hypothetical protein